MLGPEQGDRSFLLSCLGDKSLVSGDVKSPWLL